MKTRKCMLLLASAVVLTSCSLADLSNPEAYQKFQDILNHIQEQTETEQDKSYTVKFSVKEDTESQPVVAQMSYDDTKEIFYLSAELLDGSKYGKGEYEQYVWVEGNNVNISQKGSIYSDFIENEQPLEESIFNQYVVNGENKEEASYNFEANILDYGYVDIDTVSLSLIPLVMDPSMIEQDIPGVKTSYTSTADGNIHAIVTQYTDTEHINIELEITDYKLRYAKGSGIFENQFYDFNLSIEYGIPTIALPEFTPNTTEEEMNQGVIQ